MAYTVNQLAKTSGVSRRTLHYYDEIGLLKPAYTGENGYRFYDDSSLLALQQILFYRELGLPLGEIKAILSRPGFDLLSALGDHRQALLARLEQVNQLIQTVDRTIAYLKGENEMSPKDFYAGFDEAQQKEYAREAVERWGDQVTASQRNWEKSTPQEKNQFLASMNEISTGLAGCMELGIEAPETQAWVKRWYDFINEKCFNCPQDVFATLGHMYVEDARFFKNIEKVRPGLASFLDQAMTYYSQKNG